MRDKAALVVTSISAPNKALEELAAGCVREGIHFFVIGDQASPADFSLEGCDFYSLGKQKRTDLQLARECPTKHYARKNLGYLLAMQSGAELIIETDDDNLPYDSFWQQRQLQHNCPLVKQQGWVNVYRYFTEANIWPRGLALEAVLQQAPETESMTTQTMYCPIQQGLADENPDVDAIYRLVLPLPQNFRRDGAIALGRGSWCPFNSQNTTWYPAAWLLMYLPSYCSFRMTDIWRSFIAQRIAWENGWPVLFHGPTVWQERNEHNLMRNFDDEIPGYQHNHRICQELEALQLKPGRQNIGSNLKQCYARLIELRFISENEMNLLNLWLEDVHNSVK